MMIMSIMNRTSAKHNFGLLRLYVGIDRCDLLVTVLQKHVWGPMTNMLFVFAVAMCKATLVVAFFMHYKYEKNWKYIVTLPALIVGIAAVFAFLPDIAIGTWPKMTWHP